MSSLGPRGGSDGDDTCGGGEALGRNRCDDDADGAENDLEAAAATAAAAKTEGGSGGTRNILLTNVVGVGFTYFWNLYLRFGSRSSQAFRNVSRFGEHGHFSYAVLSTSFVF